MQRKVLWLLVPLLVSPASVTWAGEARPEAKPIVITLAMWTGSEAYWESLGKRFEEENPGVKVQFLFKPFDQYFDAMATMAASGVAPDLIVANPQHAPLFIQNIWRPLDDFIRRDGFRFNDYLEAAWAYGRQDGKVWAWPAGVDNPFPNHVYAYNVDLFNQAGVTTDVTRWTTAEFLALAKKLTQDRNGDGKPEQYGTNRPTQNWYWNWVWSNGGDLLSEDRRTFLLTKPPAVEALQYMVDLEAVHHVATGGGVAQFRSQQMATINVSLSGITKAAALDPFPFDWRVTRYPAGRAGEAIGRAGDLPLGIYRGSPNPETAWAFLRFLSRRDVQSWATFDTGLMSAPFHRGVVLSQRYARPSQPPHDLMPLITQKFRFLPVFPGWMDMDRLVLQALAKAQTGSISVANALGQIEGAVQALLLK